MKRIALVLVLAFAPACLAMEAESTHPEVEKTDHAAAGHEEHHASPFALWKVIVVQVIAFVILLMILKKLALPIIAKGLGDRQKHIEETYRKLEAEKAEIERLTKLMQEKLAGIENEARAKTEAAVKEGTEQRKAIVAEAEGAAARILAKAKAEIEMERARAIEEIRQEMVRLALESAEKICRAQMNAARQEAMVERFIDEIDRVKA